MALLNLADALKVGTSTVDKVYAGAELVWPTDSAPAGWAATVAALNPYIWYRFNETSGVAQDSSGNGRHATASAFGSPTYQQPSLVPSDPADKSCTLTLGRVGPRSAPVAATQETSGLTVAFIYKGTGASVGNAHIIGSGLIGLRAGSTFAFQDWSATWDTGVSTSIIKDNAPHLIVMSWTHLNAKLYVDGTQVAASTSARLLNGTSGLEIGHSGGSSYVNGQYDEFIYYDKALSPTEVATLHAAWLG